MLDVHLKPVKLSVGKLNPDLAQECNKKEKIRFGCQTPRDHFSCCSSFLVPIFSHPQLTSASLTLVLPDDDPVFLADPTWDGKVQHEDAHYSKSC